MDGIGKQRHGGERVGQFGHGTQRDFDDHAQRAFRTDEQLREIEPGDTFCRVPPHRGDFTVCGHHLEAAHKVPGHTVFHTAHTARVGGHVPANSGNRHRAGVRRVRQVELG